jgi:signal transduction histidine kinase
MLVVCITLAVGLVAAGYLNYRAARRAGEAVLRSRARDATGSAVAMIRLGRRLQQLDLPAVAKETARDGIQVAIINPRQRTIVANSLSPASAPAAIAKTKQQQLQLPGSLRTQLKTRGEALVREADRLELWRPIHTGRAARRRWRRAMRAKGLDWRSRPRPRGLRRPGLLLLRVRVSARLASEVIGPARLALIVSAAAALLLLLSALGLHRAARRADRIAAELRRKHTLSSLGEMAAVLAHEIRTPLGSMKGNAQLIAEVAPDDERAAAIVGEAARLERLVNGMLDYARPDELVHGNADPDLIGERAAEIVAPRAAELGVGLLTDPCGEDAELSADGDKLLQVLVNLLQNAVEASAEAGSDEPVVLQVRRKRRHVLFTVRDRGAGLTQPLDQLVRPFYSTKRQGTGLGLSVARQIVEQHGGELSLLPRPDGGVDAQVRIPANLPGQAPTGASRDPNSKGEQGADDHQRHPPR